MACRPSCENNGLEKYEGGWRDGNGRSQNFEFTRSSRKRPLAKAR